MGVEVFVKEPIASIEEWQIFYFFWIKKE